MSYAGTVGAASNVRFLAKGADYSDPRVSSPTSIATLKSRGVKFVGRYINGTATHAVPHPKTLTKTERNQLLSAGLGIYLVWETSEHRANGGWEAGLLDGALADADARFLGYPDICPIVAAVDWAVSTTAYAPAGVDVLSKANVIAYLEAFRETCGFEVGVYGGSTIIDGWDGGYSPLSSQAGSWGWSTQVSPRTHILQFLAAPSSSPASLAFERSWDPNLCLHSFNVQTLHPGIITGPSSPFFSLGGPFNPSTGMYSNYPYKYKPNVSFGKVNSNVKYLQGALRNILRYNVIVSGTFDAMTVAAVRAFQTKNKITVDGIVGKQTWSYIDKYVLGFWVP